jgi:hypothetical protein
MSRRGSWLGACSGLQSGSPIPVLQVFIIWQPNFQAEGQGVLRQGDLCLLAWDARAAFSVASASGRRARSLLAFRPEQPLMAYMCIYRRVVYR